jgi:hypothetical protein
MSMKLPVQEYAEVVAALKVAADDVAAAEGRRAARMIVGAKVDLHLISNSKPARSFSALTRDVSLSGVGLLQSVALPAGQEVILTLPRATGPLFVHCVVKHCRVLADGLLTVGLEYTKLADAALTAALIKQGQDHRARIAASVIG